MDSGDSSTHNSGSMSSRDQYLNHLNKLSHKISKPTFKKPSFDHPFDHNFNFRPPAPAQHQPPVYNINKNDFRDVVQKLTGSPAHERFSTPPPIHPPKPQSSRLQRIRPPPLAHVSNRPPPMLHPLSPLPPLPSVHAAAESPVSAYMRFLQNPGSNLDQFSGFSPPQQFEFPCSPLPFGCFNSPKSPYPLLSPGLGVLFSPSSGFPQFPLSPKVAASSPSWRDI